MFMYVLFCPGQLSHFPSCFGAGVTNLNEPPSGFLLPPHYCGLGSGSIPVRAVVSKKQCETRGLFMPLLLLNRRCTSLTGISASKMTYCVKFGIKVYSLTLRTASRLHCLSQRLKVETKTGYMMRVINDCRTLEPHH